MRVRVRVKADDLGQHEKERGVRGGMGLRPSFKTGMKETRAAVYSCPVCTLHEAPREGRSEAEMEPTFHSPNCIPGKGLYLSRGKSFTHRGQRGMVQRVG